MVISQILWWTEIAVEAFILVRSINAKLYGKYPAFYLYLSIVFLLELLRFSVHAIHPSVYPPVYWYTEFLAATVSYAVIIEIYDQTLKGSPGLSRVARSALLGVLAAVILKVTVGVLASAARPEAAVIIMSQQLERNVRAVQTVLLLLIIALLVYYKVPIGRNLKGIAFGYSLYVGSIVMSLAFGSLPGHALQQEWRVVQRLVYLVVLLIWSFTLWSYQPNPQRETESEIERDYRVIAERTRRALSRARSFLKLSGEL